MKSGKKAKGLQNGSTEEQGEETSTETRKEKKRKRSSEQDGEQNGSDAEDQATTKKCKNSKNNGLDGTLLLLTILFSFSLCFVGYVLITQIVGD